ncbi:hypothetical protein M0804_005821 [Polistes exclamans]|nr:hypothetical protein M0804_005821 [Polistes exclamans]
MLRDAWTNDGGKGWWRCWSRLGGLLAMATAISCLVVPFPGASANPEAKRLYDDLLSNYNRLIRPVGNNSDRLTVKMGLRLSQLIDVTTGHECSASNCCNYRPQLRSSYSLTNTITNTHCHCRRTVVGILVWYASASADVGTPNRGCFQLLHRV